MIEILSAIREAQITEDADRLDKIIDPRSATMALGVYCKSVRREKMVEIKDDRGQ
jgi:hypothetical protein